MSFVHLHVHTEYSFDATSKIEALFARAEKLGMPGLAITDHGTLAGIPEFLAVAERFPTVKPIAGCEFFLGEDAAHLILLAKNLTGYRNLVKLSSLSSSRQAPRRNCISREMLEQYHEGLICTSACIGGEIPRLILADKPGEAMAAALWYKRVFGDDFYLEVSLHESKEPVPLAQDDDPAAYRTNNEALVRKQKESNAAVLLLGSLLDIKVVATNDIHFVEREDAIAHDLFLCITRKARVSDANRRRYSHLEYLKSEQEMQQLFPAHPEVLANTLEVLEKVERYDIRHRPLSPQVAERPDEKLRTLVYEGAQQRYGEISGAVRERIESELAAVAESGFSAFFLTFKEIVDWAQEKGHLFNLCGYGSASVINYCLGIAAADPMLLGLPFELLLKPGSTEFPEIRLAFTDKGLTGLYSYLRSRFGEESVCRCAMYPSLLQKELRREMDRAADHPDQDTFDRLLCVKFGRLFVHRAAILIAPGNVSDYIPVTTAGILPDGTRLLCSQYESRWAEEAGLMRLSIFEAYATFLPKD